MNFSSQKLVKAIFTLGILAFFLFGVFGVMNFGMDTGVGGTMSHCPFADGMLVCNMSPFEHIAAWQSMFTSLSRQQQDIGSLVLLLLVSFLVVAWIRKIYPPSKNLLRQFLYVRHKEYIPLGNFLQEAFSNGILNPKIY
jgi:hypothetical protein